MPIALADQLAIHDILARIDHAVDARDWDTYVQHFSERGSLDSGFAGMVEGRAAIRDWLIANEANTSGKRHVATNVILDAEGERVVARSYLTVIEREDIPRVVATATIRDVLAREGDGWKIQLHEVRVDPGMIKAWQAAQAAQAS